MKVSLLLATLALSLQAHAAPGPTRVLYLGKDGTASPKHCAALMQELGRDAIWFDYTANPSEVTPEWLAKFDAVLLDAPKESFPSLAGTLPAGQLWQKCSLAKPHAVPLRVDQYSPTRTVAPPTPCEASSCSPRSTLERPRSRPARDRRRPRSG